MNYEYQSKLSIYNYYKEIKSKKMKINQDM